MIKLFAAVFICAALSITVFSQEIKPLESVSDIEKILNDHKGKTVFLNLWASWCKPCVAEMPEIIKLYNNYKDKGLVIVFISLDDASQIETKAMNVIKNNNVDFITYYNKSIKDEELINFIDKDYGGALPYTKIYDKEGNTRKTIEGTGNYEQFEKEIINLLD